MELLGTRAYNRFLQYSLLIAEDKSFTLLFSLSEERLSYKLLFPDWYCRHVLSCRCNIRSTIVRTNAWVSSWCLDKHQIRWPDR